MEIDDAVRQLGAFGHRRQGGSGKPAFGDRVDGGLDQLAAAHLPRCRPARGVGNLRSQLGRRGILGASFAQDAITRTELDFVREADRVNAEVDVAEFEFNLKGLEQESQIALANLSRELTEFGIAAQFVTNLNSFEQRRFEAQLELAAAAFRNRTSNTSRTRIGGTRFGPGGPLGSFGFGSPTNFAGPATFGATTPTPIQTSPFTGPLSFGNTFQQPPEAKSSFPTIA